jgi:hypothetical protein
LAEKEKAYGNKDERRLEVEDEGLLKDLVAIFIFLEALCTVRCLF